MKENLKRKLVKPTDIIIILLIVAACGVALLFMKNSENTGLLAQISYDGKVVEEIKLDTAQNTTFQLSENKKASFQISDRKIRFVNTDCPDKLCENFGYLDTANEVAICLPNRVSLKLIGAKDEIDILVN